MKSVLVIAMALLTGTASASWVCQAKNEKAFATLEGLNLPAGNYQQGTNLIFLPANCDHPHKVAFNNCYVGKYKVSIGVDPAQSSIEIKSNDYLPLNCGVLD